MVPCGPQVPLEVTERLHTEAEPVVDSEAETVAVVDSVAEECKFLLPDKFFPQKHRITNLIYFQVFYADNLIFMFSIIVIDAPLSVVTFCNLIFVS